MATSRKAKMATKQRSRAIAKPDAAPQVDEDELFYRILAVFDPERLIVARRSASRGNPAEATNELPAQVSKCGTPELASVVEDVVRNYDVLSRDFREKVDPYIRVHKQDDTYTVEYPSPAD